MPFESVPKTLLTLWFGDWSDDQPIPETGDPIIAQWWVKDPAFDRTLKEQFGPARDAALAGELDHWAHTADTCVALILLLDQVSRNVHRDTAQAFEADAKARAITHAIIAGPLWSEMPPIWRYFVTMPLMHSESLEDHALAVRTFQALKDKTAHTARASNYANALSFEQKHRDIIVQFGRYPHRNKILGRDSTDEERAFLTQPGSSF